MALLARRTVADEAHRIDRLESRAAGDQRAAAGERRGAAEIGFDGGHDIEHLGEASVAGLAAGEIAGTRPDEAHAAAAQDVQIVARRGMVPHAHVHRRRDQDRLVGRQQRGGGEIVGDALGHARQDIGGGGRDDDEVGLARQADMPHLALVGQRKQIAIDLVARQRGERQRRDELGARGGQDAAHGRAPLAQTPDQIEAFVSRDAARHDEQNAFTRNHGGNTQVKLRWKIVIKHNHPGRAVQGQNRGRKKRSRY